MRLLIWDFMGWVYYVVGDLIKERPSPQGADLSKVFIGFLLFREVID
jgi:hypothetical protein